METILQNHSIQYAKQGSYLFALETYNLGLGTWVNVTGLSNRELFEWLGY